MKTIKPRHDQPRWPVRPFLVAAWTASAGLLLWAGRALAAGGKPATQLVNVADTRVLEPGFSRWIAGVYNESFLLFGLLVVVVMGGMGLVLGLLADRVFGLLGIHLGRLDHHE